MKKTSGETMTEPAPLTKVEWIKKELATEGFYPTELGIERVLNGDAPDAFEDALVDIILELETEWGSE
jgi:hypothetical protein